YAHLHEKASRVVVKQDTREIILDISPLNGKTIEEDLLRRDFTINAMAAPLDEVVRYLKQLPASGEEGRPQGSPLPYTDSPDRSMVGATLAVGLDPVGGLADIAARRLRAVDDDIFKHDPLRMLRAVRLMMRYRMSMGPETEGLLTRDAQLLRSVAAERV